MNLTPVLANAAFILFLCAAAAQVIWLFKKGRPADPVSHWLLLGAAILLLASLIARSVKISFIALTSTYESLAFFAAATALVLFAYRRQRRLVYRPAIALGGTLAAIIYLAIASSPLIPKEALAPIPALRSAWLLLHVSFAFLGEAFFVASFIAALLFLFSKDAARREELDRVIYTAIAVGYPLFTAGALAFGAIWAESAWGRWWSWDPKETWALVTWLVYSGYLHLRLIKGRKDALSVIVAALGFLCAMFTFFGVNYLLPGLHSYR